MADQVSKDMTTEQGRSAVDVAGLEPEDLEAIHRALPLVDMALLYAANNATDDQRNQPAWVWYDNRTDYTHPGRWAANNSAAPYVRLDLVLAALPALLSLASDNARITTERDAWHLSFETCARDYREARENAEAENARLREALKPFAMTSSLPDDTALQGLPASALLTVGDLRRANEALFSPEATRRGNEINVGSAERLGKGEADDGH